MRGSRRSTGRRNFDLLFGALIPTIVCLPLFGLFLVFGSVFSTLRDPAVWVCAIGILTLFLLWVLHLVGYGALRRKPLLKWIAAATGGAWLFVLSYMIYVTIYLREWRVVFQSPVSVAFRNISWGPAGVLIWVAWLAPVAVVLRCGYDYFRARIRLTGTRGTR